MDTETIKQIKQAFFEQTAGEVDPTSIQDFDILSHPESHTWYLHAIPEQEWFAEIVYCTGEYGVTLHTYQNWEKLANV